MYVTEKMSFIGRGMNRSFYKFKPIDFKNEYQFQVMTKDGLDPNSNYAITGIELNHPDEFFHSGEYCLAHSLYREGIDPFSQMLILPLAYSIVSENNIAIVYKLIENYASLHDCLSQKIFIDYTQIIKDLKNSLNLIHQFCYAHLDLKPANIFIKNHRAYLIDFNICIESAPHHQKLREIDRKALAKILQNISSIVENNK